MQKSHIVEHCSVSKKIKPSKNILRQKLIDIFHFETLELEKYEELKDWIEKEYVRKCKCRV